MRRHRWLIMVAAMTLVLAGAALWHYHWQLPTVATLIPSTASNDRAAFERWIGASPARADNFAAFDRFIAQSGYADVVPSWQLLRANSAQILRCPVAPFILPPRRTWRNILPALRLVREQVIPAVGRVNVASVFRTSSANACSRGASQSRHLTFAAIDLLPIDQPDPVASFRRLCRAWRQAGPASGWGLGAYYDLARRDQNSIGRFHVDGTGWRTWGFSYGRASSSCNAL